LAALLRTGSTSAKISIKLQVNATLLLERSPFSRTGKNFTYAADKAPKAHHTLVAINGLPFFGADGEMPQYTLANVTLLLNGHRYSLLTDRMYNPWFGSNATAYPDKKCFKLVKTANGYVLRGMFSDGAGGYEAEWRLAGASSKRIVLTTDDAYFF
jgi:hypothetical protein